jgi:calcineurin-like phosphoesterase family protein
MEGDTPPIYFSSDLYLGCKIKEGDPHGWESAEQRDNLLARRMIPVPEDINRASELWLLGDLAVSRKALQLFMQTIRPFWKQIHLVKGDQDDRAAWRLQELFDSAQTAHYLRINPELKIYLSHYEHREWKGSRGGSLHLHGHSEGRFHRKVRAASVAVEEWGYTPCRLVELVKTLL